MSLNDERLNELERRIDLIEFRQQLLFENDEVSRMLFEYEITREQYRKIMDLMDSIRKKINNKEEFSSEKFESDMYDIIPSHKGDYHMCEYFARSFMETGRWDEVFPALYGEAPKYRYMMENNNG